MISQVLLYQLSSGIENVLAALMQIAIIVILTLLGSFIKQKFGENAAKIYVASIEQTKNELSGPEKKKLVEDLLTKKLGKLKWIGWFFNAVEIDHLIEAAVNAMNSVIDSKKKELSEMQSDSEGENTTSQATTGKLPESQQNFIQERVEPVQPAKIEPVTEVSEIKPEDKSTDEIITGSSIAPATKIISAGEFETAVTEVLSKLGIKVG